MRTGGARSGDESPERRVARRAERSRLHATVNRSPLSGCYKHQRQDVGGLGKQLDLPFTTWSVTKLAGYSASTRGSRSARVGLPDPARGWDPVAGQEDLEGQP